ncbi:cellulase family glycosylhydrolase [Saccharicrinis aurantiacus]|uniref:cellulase family glycosylhydrolase n=1 Tax=Saccharicrinis aurantiacus TaxID=1849719 RepID=UPI000839252F|nr:cellulase family glycosylhydrolase [Saccharicrinis aurantiacus]
MRLFSAILIALTIMSCTPKNQVTVNINTTDIVTENFIGNGVQLDPYPHADTKDADWGLLMTPEKWARVYHRLDYMQPHFMRIVDQANWRYLKGFDKNNNPIIDFDTDEEKVLEQLLDYCEKNNITVLLGEWGVPYEVHDVDAGFSGILKGANDPVWISMIVDHLDYLINTKGYTCIRYFNLVNEPNGDWSTVDGDYDQWREGASMLAQALRDKGLDKTVTIAGPDAVAHCDNHKSDYTGMEWIHQAADDLKDDMGALEIHAYLEAHIIREGRIEIDYANLAEKAREVNLPILFGELGTDRNSAENQARVAKDPYACEDSQMDVYDFSYGIDMANATIQVMNTGFHGSAAWAADDAMHTLNDLGNKNEIKRWGFWNSLGTELCNNPADEAIRPWFYTWSLTCRYIQPGSSIVKTEVLNCEGLRVVTAVNGKQVTIGIVNTTEADHNLTLNADVASNALFQEFVYEENAYKVDAEEFPVAEQNKLSFKQNQLDISVAANSFRLLTTYSF